MPVQPKIQEIFPHYLLSSLSFSIITWGLGLSLIDVSSAAVAQALPKPAPTLKEQAAEVGIEPALLENSPVLRRWLQRPPDILQDIQNTPIFSPHLRTGITSRNNDLGAEISVEDIFVGQTPITLSGSYQTEFAGREQSVALQMRYYTLPLGSYFNIAPTLGYRQISPNQQPQVSGVDLGVQGVFVLSPHAADLRIGQTFTAPGATNETGITSIAASYAITTTIRLHSRVEWRRNPGFYDQRFGMGLEIRL